MGTCLSSFGRLAVPVINDREDYKSFELGKGVVLREGRKGHHFIDRHSLPVAETPGKAEKNGNRWYRCKK